MLFQKTLSHPWSLFWQKTITSHGNCPSVIITAALNTIFSLDAIQWTLPVLFQHQFKGWHSCLGSCNPGKQTWQRLSVQQLWTVETVHSSTARIWRQKLHSYTGMKKALSKLALQESLNRVKKRLNWLEVLSQCPQAHKALPVLLHKTVKRGQGYSGQYGLQSLKKSPVLQRKNRSSKKSSRKIIPFQCLSVTTSHAWHEVKFRTFPCPAEALRPITASQQEEREQMKRNAQHEREQAARVTQLGQDRNIHKVCLQTKKIKMNELLSSHLFFII